jgi:Flp pilus assembly protein CpaB
MKTRLIGAILAIVLALVGTAVLTGYVGDADARAAAGAELVPVYVVSTKIPAGTKAADIGAFIVEKRIPLIAAAPGRVTELADLDGLVSDVALVKGEQLLGSRWVEPSQRSSRGTVAVPVGLQSVTVALPVEQVVGGVVEAGDTVGVVVSARLKSNDTADELTIAKQVYHKVLVTAVQQGTTTQPGEADKPAEPVSAVMVTLAASTPQVEKIVWAQEFGVIWLTLEPEDADETGSRIVDGQVMFE